MHCTVGVCCNSKLDDKHYHSAAKASSKLVLLLVLCNNEKTSFFPNNTLFILNNTFWHGCFLLFENDRALYPYHVVATVIVFYGY